MANDKGSAGMIAQVGVILFFVIGFILLPLLPWAEIGLPTGAQLPPIVIGPFSIDLNALHLNGLYDAANSQLPQLVKKVQNDPNYQFCVYSFFLGMAMIASAIGLHLVGREESEEKTVLPAKK
jgi:hypothetical protein